MNTDIGQDVNKSMKDESDRMAEHIRNNETNYHNDPDPDELVDENPEVPNGMTGDHQDDFNIG